MEWFDETLHTGVRQRFAVEEVLHREQTDFQDLIIFRNPVFGRMMALQPLDSLLRLPVVGIEGQYRLQVDPRFGRGLGDSR